MRVWDMKSQKNVTVFEGHGEGSINGLCFSENGYHLASAGQDGVVKVWDLRKLKCVATLEGDGAPVNGVTYDRSGKFLAAASSLRNFSGSL